MKNAVRIESVTPTAESGDGDDFDELVKWYMID